MGSKKANKEETHQEWRVREPELVHQAQQMQNSLQASTCIFVKAVSKLDILLCWAERPYHKQGT